MAARRGLLEAMVGLGAASILQGALDENSWRAYELVEESWIREKHALLVQQSPAASSPADIDLELQLAELQRRGMQFRHMINRHPRQLRGGAWQLTWLPTCSHSSHAELEASIPRMTVALRNHPDYNDFRQAQMRLWKTPEYKHLHTQYLGRMQELNQVRR